MRPTVTTRRPGSLADTAYGILKQRIIRCELAPAHRLTEAQLVADIGIGKTPVREALARLVQDGLVRNIPRHGYEISPITLGDVQDHFGLRFIVEPAAVQLAVRHLTPAQLRRLRDLAAIGYVMGDAESVANFLRANREFHTIIASAAGNRRLLDLIEKLLDESERMQHLGMMIWDRSAQAAHEHQAIVTALEEGDAEAARHVAAEQIMATQHQIIDALLTSPALLAAPIGATSGSTNPSRRMTAAKDGAARLQR